MFAVWKSNRVSVWRGRKGMSKGITVEKAGKKLAKMMKRMVKTKANYYCAHCKIPPNCNLCVAHFGIGIIEYKPHKEPCEYYKPKNIFCRRIYDR
jgi:hypothetical protein